MARVLQAKSVELTKHFAAFTLDDPEVALLQSRNDMRDGKYAPTT